MFKYCKNVSLYKRNVLNFKNYSLSLWCMTKKVNMSSISCKYPLVQRLNLLGEMRSRSSRFNFTLKTDVCIAPAKRKKKNIPAQSAEVSAVCYTQVSERNASDVSPDQILGWWVVIWRLYCEFARSKSDKKAALDPRGPDSVVPHVNCLCKVFSGNIQTEPVRF